MDQTLSPLIEGRWQLMFTTRPGTASPIQVCISDRTLPTYLFQNFQIKLCFKNMFTHKYSAQQSSWTCLCLQRTFVGVDAFTVFQEIELTGTTDPRVSNIVRASESIGELKVEVRNFQLRCVGAKYFSTASVSHSVTDLN